MSSDTNPYASPAAAIDPPFDPPAGRSTNQSGFRPATHLTRTLKVLLGLQIAISVLLVLAMAVWYADLQRHYATGMDQEQSNLHYRVQTPLGLTDLGLYVAVTIVFFVWLHRIQSNLYFLENDELRFTPGWAVGWFFVPFANRVKPYQVLREAWQASDPKTAGRRALEWSAVSSAAVVAWWWGLRLVSVIVSHVVSVTYTGAVTVDDFQQAALISLIGFIVVDIPYLAIHWRLVQRIHQMQLNRYAKLNAVAPEPNPEASRFA